MIKKIVYIHYWLLAIVCNLVIIHRSSSKAGHQIYLGESYRVYVSLGNEIKSAVTDIVLKVRNMIG